MWIRRIEVKNCSGIAAAGVDLGPGLNLLYGPNELGKSSLVRAIRAALLLQASSTAAEELSDWHVDAPPEVSITLEQEPGRIYRVRKVFGGQGSQSYLEFSRDGVSFEQEHKGRGVDAALQAILKWGVDSPGGRGRRKRGMPASFISTALLGEQSDVVAILQTSLEDGTGRERLTEALQAMAEDPRLKQIIASTQGEVDRAFTATGRRRGGQGSIWSQIREQLIGAEEHHRNVRAQMAESEGARARIEELREALLEAQSVEAKARELVTAGEDTERSWHQHESLRAAYDKAAEVVESARAITTGRDDKARELAEADQAVAHLVEGESKARNALGETQGELEGARETVRELEAGAGEQQRRLREQEVENRRLSLERDRDALTPRLELASRLEKLDAEIRSLDDEHTALDTSLTAARDLLHQATAKTEQDQEDLEDLEFDLHVTRLLRARASARDADESLKRARDANERARELTAQATELRSTIIPSGPTEDEIESLRGSSAELRIAREKLEVGLSMELDLETHIEVAVGIDSEEPARVDAQTEVEAAREIEIRLRNIGTIKVRGGSADLARAADAAQTAWLDASSPVFERTGCETLDELIERRKAIVEHEANAVEIERRAADAQASAEDMDELERNAAVAAAEVDRIATIAQEYLEEPIHEYVDALDDVPGDESAIEEAIYALRTEMEKRASLCREMEVKVATDETGLKSIEAQRLSKQADLNAQSIEFEGGWQKYLDEAEGSRQDVDGALAANEAELASIRAEATTEVDSARTILEELQSAFDEVQQDLTETTRRLEAARAEQARLAGELAERKKAAEDTDLAAVEAALAEAEASLGAIGPVEEPNAERLEHWRAELEEAEITVRRLDGDLRSAEGALQQVGGQYAEEQVHQAVERVDAIREREHDLEVEFGAWKMLREVLTEAEREDAVHLGNALVQPVSDRMRALTANRYGDIVIGPQLDSSGIEFAGGERSFERLSVGTQEQIALLLRLSIAEALEAFVVLDDQLTQSDQARVAVMLQFITEAAKEIQVVVLTCHRDDYAITDESANVIDLSGHLTRTVANDTAASDQADAETSEPSTGVDESSVEADEPLAAEPPRRRRRRRPRDDARGEDLESALRASLKDDDE